MILDILSCTIYFIYILICFISAYVLFNKSKIVNNFYLYLGVTSYCFLSILVINYFVNESRQNTRTILVQEARNFAKTVEFLGHEALNDQTNSKNVTYQKLIELEKQWLLIQPNIEDIYTMKRNDKKGLYLMVDSETDYNHNGSIDEEREQRTPIGELYEKKLSEIEDAFNGISTFTDNFYTDKWGSWVSSFVPLRARNGDVDGILGVDFKAEEFLKASHKILLINTFFFYLVFIFVFTVTRMEFKNIKARKELSIALTEAEMAKKIKSQFLSTMSHELRTPLNGIIGPSLLLKDENLVLANGKPYLKVIIACTNQLLDLVNDVLDYSKLEAQGMTLENIKFDINLLVKECLDVIRYRAEEKKLNLDLKISSKNLEITGDPTRIKQILLNFLSNAIKFSEKGKIEIDVSVDRNSKLNPKTKEKNESENEYFLKIGVKDSGRGITPEEQQKLFKSFSQIDGSTTRKYGGTGLGLAISKSLIEMMGGIVKVESEIGIGSLFEFQIPTRCDNFLSEAKNRNENDVTSTYVDLSEYKLNALVVDDLSINRFTLCHILKSIGVKSIESSSGLDAIDKIKFGIQFYDFIFMDIMMPDLDGIQTTIEIKKIAKHIPIICSSATTDFESRNRCLESGMIGFLKKPYYKSNIVSVIEENLPHLLKKDEGIAS